MTSELGLNLAGVERVLEPVVDWRAVLHAAVRRGVGWASGAPPLRPSIVRDYAPILVQ